MEIVKLAPAALVFQEIIEQREQGKAVLVALSRREPRACVRGRLESWSLEETEPSKPARGKKECKDSRAGLEKDWI
jgi:hypothetical protein